MTRRSGYRRDPHSAWPAGRPPAGPEPAHALRGGPDRVSAFGTAYAAHALYQFIGPAAAFVMLGAIAVATMLAAALHGPGLAGLGLAGALVVPLLIASHEPNPWPVVLYLVMVAGAAYALARLRRWLLLGAATVAGGVLWGLALLAPPAGAAPGAWQAALLVHTGVQLALAAAFIAIEPHLTTADPAAEPDWFATLALAALAVLAVQALAATRTHERWSLFVVAALAVLGATAWRSAPAAGAGVLAGILALAALAVWPALGAPPEPGLAPAPTPALEGILRLPENVSSFLAFAALTAVSVFAAPPCGSGAAVPFRRRPPASTLWPGS